MVQLPFSFLPILALCFHLAAFVGYFLGHKRIGKSTAWIGFLLLAGTAMINWSLVHRLPVYSLYESLLHMALVLSACLTVLSTTRPGHSALTWGNLLLTILLIAAVPVLRQFNPDFYMYQVWPVQLFFALRLTAGGVFLFAFLLFATAWPQEYNNTRNGAELLHLADLILILAAILFLGSELSGTIWCMLGWGDTWHWSSNFFQSASIFLLLMLPLHIPPGWKKGAFRAGTGSICTLIAALAIIIP
jgi:hypothetical protein